MQVTSAKLASPSMKSLVVAGLSAKMTKGVVPSSRVIVAFCGNQRIVHRHVFASAQVERAMQIVEALKNGASVDMKNWRVAERGEF